VIRQAFEDVLMLVKQPKDKSPGHLIFSLLCLNEKQRSLETIIHVINPPFFFMQVHLNAS
ncbi:MAG: hypothetical protein QNJ09_14625, partial [Paracoccaceae bacterium]|nr:hypothetical protein [Paracoccaceae bacterium]